MSALPCTGPQGGPFDGLSYTVDGEGTIVAVGGSWDDFARRNGGEAILSTRIIGKKLDQFIHGDETLMFMRTMIMSARVLDTAIQRPYRCDSPALKRYMEMTLQPHADGVVEVIHRELRSEPVAHPVRMMAVPCGNGSRFVKRCSVCNRLRIQEVWSEVDEAVADGRLLPQDLHALKVFYGVCPQCLAHQGLKSGG